jgi:hypothetical protein
MQLFLEIVAIVLLAWVGYSIRKLVVLLARMAVDRDGRCDTLHPVYSWSDIDRESVNLQKALQ